MTLITIRFSPNKRNKSTIDFEANHTVYEAVETIYKLHNHALNYGNKYTLEITISEDQQEVLIDEIPIGTIKTGIEIRKSPGNFSSTAFR